MNEPLERLLVTIEGSAELLRQELRKGGVDVDRWARDTESRVGKVDNSFKKVASTLRTTLAAFGVGLSATALINFTRNAISAADAVGESARAAGFHAERFQRLGFVFRQDGVEAQEFEAAMRTANTRLGQFITTGAGPAAKAIEQLGLKQRIANGEIRNNEQFVDAVIEALSKVESSAERAALASAFFGREAGAKLQNSLGKGIETINAAADAATGIFTDATVRRADEVADAWERIAGAAGRWAQSVAVGAVHEAARAAGVEGITGETPLERAKRLREVAASDERAFPNTRNQQRIELRARLRAEAEAIEEHERLLALPFVTGRASPPPPPDDGLSEIAVKAQRISSIADIREQRRRLGLKQLPADAGLQEIGVTQRRFANGDEFFAARGERLDRLGLKQFPIDAQAIKRMEEYGEAVEKARARQQRFGDAIAASFDSQAWAALRNGKPREAIRGLIQDFAELVVRMKILQPIAEKLAATLSGISLGAAGGGGFFAGLFRFASGGRPPVGRASWVGEGGPELFVPDVPGRIYSNAQSMRVAGAGGIVINNSAVINGGGDDTEATAAAVNRAMAGWSRSTVAQVKELIRRRRV